MMITGIAPFDWGTKFPDDSGQWIQAAIAGATSGAASTNEARTPWSGGAAVIDEAGTPVSGGGVTATDESGTLLAGGSSLAQVEAAILAALPAAVSVPSMPDAVQAAVLGQVAAAPAVQLNSSLGQMVAAAASTFAGAFSAGTGALGPAQAATMGPAPVAAAAAGSGGMATVGQINGDLGAARDAVFNQMAALMTDSTMSLGDKTKALMNGQAELGITDGVQNLMAKAYNRWQQTGQ